jgi:hypothetical protein
MKIIIEYNTHIELHNRKYQMEHMMDRPTTPMVVVEVLEKYNIDVVATYSDKRRYTTFRKYVLSGCMNASDGMRAAIIDEVKSELAVHGLQCNAIGFVFYDSPTLGKYWGIAMTNLIGNFTLLNRDKKEV